MASSSSSSSLAVSTIVQIPPRRSETKLFDLSEDCVWLIFSFAGIPSMRTLIRVCHLFERTVRSIQKSFVEKFVFRSFWFLNFVFCFFPSKEWRSDKLVGKESPNIHSPSVSLSENVACWNRCRRGWWRGWWRVFGKIGWGRSRRKVVDGFIRGTCFLGDEFECFGAKKFWCYAGNEGKERDW